ncbi:GNAT family N-acetyltransferase [Alkalimonas amylolytica]|uniref:Protein N-acetyltransferase, RimJ/RimL family n=1 Tax=Alkalimonas amylolytica TaxID=152573 RepID=A0A1H3ZDM0_ALKAM|nr:GNAT family N-acetyltransferase [Alkalimonas amylolytica]SEA21725.1 Protein N-acetyltransferase, RimJ/RimL family [Alkalimonas amylolytica]
MKQYNAACLDIGYVPVASQLTFTTAHTSVRLLTGKDQALYLQLYTDANSMRYIGRSLTEGEAVASFFKALKLNVSLQWRRLFFVIESKSSRRSLGLMGLTDTGDAGIEFGIILSQQAQGKGVATEVLQQCITRLFALGVSKVWLQLHPDNAAAIAMAQTAAMTKGTRVTANNQQTWFIEQHYNKNCRGH